MFAKQYRLQNDKDFKLVFKNGKVFNSKFLFLKIRKNSLENSRFGFIIGTKISKKSTVRNKIKRRLRESIKKKLNNIKPGFDVIIGVKPEIVDKSYQEIEKETGELLKKAGLII